MKMTYKTYSNGIILGIEGTEEEVETTVNSLINWEAAGEKVEFINRGLAYVLTTLNKLREAWHNRNEALQEIGLPIIPFEEPVYERYFLEAKGELSGHNVGVIESKPILEE